MKRKDSDIILGFPLKCCYAAIVSEKQDVKKFLNKQIGLYERMQLILRGYFSDKGFLSLPENDIYVQDCLGGLYEFQDYWPSSGYHTSYS